MGFLPLVATLASDGSRRPIYSDSKPTRTLPPPAWPCPLELCRGA